MMNRGNGPLTRREMCGLAIGVLFGLATPAAANTAIIASKYGSDYQLAAKVIYISTLLSVMTIPLVVRLLG